MLTSVLKYRQDKATKVWWMKAVLRRAMVKIDDKTEEDGGSERDDSVMVMWKARVLAIVKSR